MAGKNVEIKDADIERARKFLDAARSKFEEDFISSRYLIDAAISLQGKKGEDSGFSERFCGKYHFLGCRHTLCISNPKKGGC